MGTAVAAPTNDLLTVRSLRAECSAIAANSRRFELQRTLSNTLSTALPQALATAVQPLMENLDGVIRIHKLDVYVEYIGTYDESTLADAIAKKIAMSLQDVLRSQKHGLVLHWHSSVDYYAAYIEYRLRLGSQFAPAWAFSDFSTFDHLPAERAAAEMIVSKPSILRSLALSGKSDTGNNAARFALALDALSAKALVSSLFSEISEQPDIEQILGILQLINNGNTSYSALPAHSQVLILTLEHLASTAVDSVPLTLSAVALAVTLIELTQSTSVDEVFLRLTEEHNEEYRVKAALISSKLTDALIAFLAKQASRQALQRQLKHTQSNAKGIATKQKRSQTTTAQAEDWHSSIAGIGLLLPVIEDLNLHQLIGGNQLNASLRSLFPPEELEAVFHDAFIDWLFPPGNTDSSDVISDIPESLLAGIATESLPLIEANGTARWGQLILAAFATRLPGLKGSSTDYLIKQFLRTAGSIVANDTSIELTLQGPDLSIVLKMAGFNGQQRNITHLNNRLLTIWLAGLR